MAAHCLCVFAVLYLFPARINAQNLICNGDFEKRASTTENLWDGVDNSGRLRVPGSSAPFIADINGDGKKDIVCGDSNWVSDRPSSGMLWYYLNSGSNESPRFTTGKFINRRFDSNVKPVVVDWNRDGRKDIIFGSANGWVYFLPRKSGLKFGEGKFVEFGKDKLDIGQLAAPAAADWDGDGHKDLILGEGTYSANSVYVYLNKGISSMPSFDKNSKSYLAYGEGKMQLTPSIVDWDKDGDLDLIVGEERGYINLYINKPGKRRLKILEYAGRLKKKNGRDLKIGKMSTPCVTDWDEDGDLDLICGNSTGLIFLVLNEGSVEKPEFAEPAALRGKNALKGKSASDWTIDTRRFGSWELRNEKRTGAYSITVDSQMPHSGEYCLKITCHEGYSGKVIIHGRIKSPLKRGVKYKLSFFAREEDIESSWRVWYQPTSVRAVINEKRVYKTIEPRWVNIEKIRAGSSWNDVSGTFKLPDVKDKDIEKIVKETGAKGDEVKKKVEEFKRTLGNERTCYFGIIVSGDGTMWIDDVVLEELF